MAANDRQEGGTHYRTPAAVPQHWDLAIAFHWDPFQYQITKYVMRWRDKHPTKEGKLVDLRKARHFLDKYIEAVEADLIAHEQHHELLNTLAFHIGAPEGMPYAELVKRVISLLDAVPSCGPPDVEHSHPEALATTHTMMVPRGSVVPTGWKGFTFEGSKVDVDMYRCAHCKAYFSVPTDCPPVVHTCQAEEPGRSYVDQG